VQDLEQSDVVAENHGLAMTEGIAKFDS